MVKGTLRSLMALPTGSSSPNNFSTTVRPMNATLATRSTSFSSSGLPAMTPQSRAARKPGVTP